jgi:glycosyltransferase involved in cell wall biosynthesis
MKQEADMTRAAQFITGLAYGGAERLMVTLLPRMLEHGYHVDVVHMGASEALRPELEGRGVRVINLKSAWPYRLGSLRRLQAVIEREGYQIIHSHLWRADVAARLVGSRLPELGVVCTIHDIRRWRKVPWLDFPDRWTEARVDAYVADSEDIRRRLVQEHGIAAERVNLVYNWVEVPAEPTDADRQAAREAMGVEADAQVTITTARLSPEKGHRYLIAAARQLRPRWPRLRCMVIGTGSRRGQLERLAKREGASDVVRFLGPRPDARGLLAGADLFVLPSTLEGLPVAVLEAMAAGRPVVATQIDALAEAVVAGQTGVLVPPKDPAALAAALEELLSNGELRQRMGGAARARAAEVFAADAAAAKMASVYDQVLARSHPGP